MKLRDELRLSILIVTHDLGLAWTVADRVAVMYLEDRRDRSDRGRLAASSPSVHEGAADVVPRPAGSIARSSRGSRPTRRGSPPAGSIRDARWSRRVGRRAWGSSRGAAARTSPWKSWRPITSPRATRPRWTRRAHALGRLRRRAHRPRRQLRRSVVERLFLDLIVPLQNAEDRLHLGVRQLLVRVHPGRARGREQGRRLDSAISTRFSSSRGALGQRPRACSASVRSSRFSRASSREVFSWARRWETSCPARPGDRSSPGPGPSTRGPCVVPSRLLLLLAGAGRLARSSHARRRPRRGVQEAVGAAGGSRRLRATNARTARYRQWVGESQFPTDLRRRGVQQCALLRPLCDCGEECIDALEALLVHSRILSRCRPRAPVVRKHTFGCG